MRFTAGSSASASSISWSSFSSLWYKTRKFTIPTKMAPVGVVCANVCEGMFCVAASCFTPFYKSMAAKGLNYTIHSASSSIREKRLCHVAGL